MIPMKMDTPMHYRYLSLFTHPFVFLSFTAMSVTGSKIHTQSIQQMGLIFSRALSEGQYEECLSIYNYESLHIFCTH